MIGSIISSVGNWIAQKKQNEANIEMQNLVNRQNIQFWNMQNSYNSPAEQMKRLQSAGLNPALMYGNGASAGIAPAIAPARAPEQTYRNPIDLSSMAMFADIALKKEQQNNLIAQNDVIAQDVKLRTAETILKEAQTAGIRFDNDQKNRLKDVMAKTAEATLASIEQGVIKSKAEVGGINASTEYQLFKNRYEKDLAQTNAAFRKEELRKLRADALGAEVSASIKDRTKHYVAANIILEYAQRLRNLEGSDLENQMKQLKIDLERAGIGSASPTILKMIARYIKVKNSELQKTYDQIDSWPHNQ